MAKTVNTILKLKDQFSTPMKKCATACETYSGKAKVSKRDTENFAKTLKGNLKQSAKVAAASIVALGTAAVATGTKLVKETMEQADTVDKMSQKIGISRTAYQELDFVTSQCGASISNMKQGVKTLTNQMASAADGSESATSAFDTLGISIYDSSGNMKSQEAMMWETFDALQGMSNQTEKAAIANQLFGRAGTELMPMLNGSAGSIDELRKKAQELGLVMDDSTIDAGVKLTDTMDQIKRSMSAVAYQIGGQLMPYVQSACDYVLGHMPQIKTAIGTVKEVLTKVGSAVKWVYNNSNILIPILAGVVAGFTAFKVIGVVTTLMSTLQGVMTLVTGAEVAFNASLLACPITWIVLGITAAVAAGVALYKNWDTVCKWAGKLKAKFEKLLSPIKKVANWLGKVFGFSGKSVDVNVNNAAESTTASKSSGHATGTNYFKGGYTGFSEGGRKESAIFPSGTKIIPADQTQKALSTNTGGIIVNVTVQGNMIGNETAMKQFAEYTGKRILTAMGNC